MKASEVLSKAADLIEPVGAWTQGASYRDMFGAPLDGGEPDVACRCTVGAVNEVCDWSLGAAAPAFGFLDRRLGADTARWNDAPGRTQTEVVKALRDAAELARSEGL
jgi:hypothetical protein